MYDYTESFLKKKTRQCTQIKERVIVKYVSAVCELVSVPLEVIDCEKALPLLTSPDTSGPSSTRRLLSPKFF